MDRITPDLEAACLRVLRSAWRDLNSDRFRGALVPPALELSTAAGRLGRWDAGTRTIQISRELVLGGGWGQVIEVLKHEMAHQFVWEVTGERDETPHGPTFLAICERLGIDAAAAGMPDAGGARARLVDKVTKLLALAGSPNEHEARAAMAAAQRLMLMHNLQVAGGAGPRGYGWRHLGRPTGRVPEAEKILAGMLCRHFFVEAIWIPVWRPLEGKRGTVLEICGAPENLELAAHVHAFLIATAERLWGDFQRRMHWPRRERRTYQAGVMVGFRETLEKQEAAQRSEALVWVGDGDLTAYYKRRHPYTRSARYTPSIPGVANQAGRAAGRQIVLHKPVTAGGPNGGIKLLRG